jgi:hypothetical protein
MSEDTSKQRGRDTAARLLGRPVDLPLGVGEPASGADFRDLATAHTFGDSWTRTALDDRSRSLVSVAIAATLGTHEPLRGQLRIALRAGVTPNPQREEPGTLRRATAELSGSQTDDRSTDWRIG